MSHVLIFTARTGTPSQILKEARLNGGPIRELDVRANQSFNFFVKGFGEDANGELYVLATSEIGLGGNGVVFSVEAASGGTVVPLPPAVWTGLATSAGIAGIAALRRRRRNAVTG